MSCCDGVLSPADPASVRPAAARTVPERVRTWVQRQLNRPILAIEALGGGRTGTISAVYPDQGDPLILRHVPVAQWGEVGRRHVASEALACELLRHGDLPVPRLIASDPDGAETGAYVNLTSWLPSAVRLEPMGPDAVAELARAAARAPAGPDAERGRSRCPDPLRARRCRERHNCLRRKGWLP